MQAKELLLVQKQLLLAVVIYYLLNLARNIHATQNVVAFPLASLVQLVAKQPHCPYVNLTQPISTFPKRQAYSTINLSLKLTINISRGASMGSPRGFLQSKSWFSALFRQTSWMNSLFCKMYLDFFWGIWFQNIFISLWVHGNIDFNEWVGDPSSQQYYSSHAILHESIHPHFLATSKIPFARNHSSCSNHDSGAGIRNLQVLPQQLKTGFT